MASIADRPSDIQEGGQWRRSDKIYISYEKVEATAPYQLWHSTEQIAHLYAPIGFYPFSESDDKGIIRCFGYVPGPAFIVGFFEIIESIKMIVYRVILNQNTLEYWTSKDYDGKEKARFHGPNSVVLETKHIQPVALSGFQRLAILALAIVRFIRGLITFAQVGIILAPIDYLYQFGSCCKCR